MAKSKQVVLVFFLALVGCSAAPGWAQKLSPRYPWDFRPEKCLVNPADKAPECAADHWYDFDATANRLSLLWNGNLFDLLELALTDIATSKKRFKSGEPAETAAYWMFRTQMNGRQFDPADRDRIARWKKEIPNSYFAVFAEARYLYANAWNIRGGGFSGTISKESRELFAIRLQESEKILLDAPQSLKDTPLWHQLLLAIVLDTSSTQTIPDDAFNAAIKAWPTYYPYYEVVLTRLTPKWGGSWEAVDQFINHWAKQLEAIEGDSMYARLYISIVGSEGAAPDSTRMNWARMKKSFEELVTRYPDPFLTNVYASFACAARDKAAFGDAMRRIKAEQINPRGWIRGHSYEACARWAGV